MENNLNKLWWLLKYYFLFSSMQKLPKPEKELRKKIERLEKSLEKAYNDSVREKIWENIEKFKKELAEITKGNWGAMFDSNIGAQ